ncbi:MAG: hypothetical protein WBO89_02585, partial [Propionicimonas sp.]
MPDYATVIRPALIGDAGEILTVQRAAFVAEAQSHGDPWLPPLTETLDAVAAAIGTGAVLVLRLVNDGREGRLVGAVRRE